MLILTAAEGRTNLDQLIIELEAALEKLDSICNRASDYVTVTPESAPWPADGCPWGAELIDAAVASASINAALTILRAGQAARQAQASA